MARIDSRAIRSSLALLACSIAFAPCIGADLSAGHHFLWSIIYKDPQNRIRPIAFEESSVSLSQADKIKIYMKHDPTEFLYLFLHDSEGDLYQLYPKTSMGQRNGLGEEQVAVFIPDGLQWFEFEPNSGIERFYLFASTARLKNIEERMRTYIRTASSKNQNQKDLDAARSAALEEMKRTQLENFELVNKAKGSIVVAAGEFRGLEEGFEFPAQRVDFEEFYAWTIRISHE